MTAQWAGMFPDVASTWHPSRNGKLTAGTVGRSWPGKVWWRCPAGHEWQEQVNTRLALPKWKNGDRAACRECSGSPVVLLEYTYPECGHTRKIRKASRGKERARCWDCEQKQRAAAWGKAAAIARESAPRAAELVSQIERDYLPPGIEPPLAREFRWHAMKLMQGAIGAEEAGVRRGAIGNVTGQLRGNARGLLPSIEEAASAAAERGVLNMLGRGHWAAGWQYHLTGQPMRPVPPDTVAETVRVLATWLEAEAESTRQLLECIREEADVKLTSVVTKRITEAVRQAARANHVNAYRELWLPLLARPGAVRYGRLDVVIWSRNFPDIVIEIDSALNTGSARKLEFARDAGAVPIWVRHGTGRLDVPDGVAVIDLRTS